MIRKVSSFLQSKLREVARERDFVAVGLGNPQRGDDGVGITLIDQLKNRVKGEYFSEQDDDLAELIIKISEKSVRLVLFVDAVDFGGVPGEARLFETEDVLNLEISSHKIPLRTIMALLEGYGKWCYLLGIQPARLDRSSSISGQVMETVNQLTQIVMEVQPSKAKIKQLEAKEVVEGID